MKYSPDQLEEKATPHHTAMLLSWVSGFCCDLGKYARIYQNNLSVRTPKPEPIKHEWLSLQILEGYRKNLTWNASWEQPLIRIEDSALSNPLLTGKSAVDYLVATHHRLPFEHQDSGYISDTAYIHDRSSPRIPKSSPPKDLELDIKALLNHLDDQSNTEYYWRAVATLSRISLIMADQTVSSVNMSDQPGHGADAMVHADSIWSAGSKRKKNQSLDWYLRTVGERAAFYTQELSSMEPRGLSEPTLRSMSSKAEGITWQDKAANALSELSSPSLVFNLAGSDSGKVRASVGAIVALNKGVRECRITAAQEDSRLTLKVRDALRDELNIKSPELHCALGSGKADRPGGDSDNRFPVPEFLSDVIERSPHMKSFIGAPVLACTTGYISPAGEPDKQIHHALANVRLMQSDLILDEVESYDAQSLVVVMRLIITAAMWGRNVVVSSTSLSNIVATSMYEAYECGHRMHCELNELDESWNYAFIDHIHEPMVLQSDSDRKFTTDYRDRTYDLMESMVTTYRPAELQPVSKISFASWRKSVASAVSVLHDRHAVDVHGTRVSVGVVRCTDIAAAVRLSRSLSKLLPTAKVCCYHRQQPVVQHHHARKYLDRLLNRKITSDEWIERLSSFDGVTQAIDNSEEELQLIVVAVEAERAFHDFDFDWAVIEPSSIQSMIKTSSLVNRHRLITPTAPNIAILQFPYAHCDEAMVGQSQTMIFDKAGFETSRLRYSTHDLERLLSWEIINAIDIGLRFDDHYLAQLEDRSLWTSLKAPMDRLLMRGDHKAGWMSEKTYSRWPLVTKERHETVTQDSDGEYYKKMFVGHGRHRQVEQTVGTDLSIKEKTQNDWLTLSLEQQVKVCDSIGLAVEDGLTVSLLEDNERSLIHDHSFGFYRA